jgi:hypothetical protein
MSTAEPDIVLSSGTVRDDFDANHEVAEWHGANMFLRDGDEVYRMYFTTPRRRGAQVDLEHPRHHRARLPRCSS